MKRSHYFCRKFRQKYPSVAYRQVKRNRGAGGIDGMQVDELLPYLRDHQSELIQQLREGKYKPNPVRRVEIPKEGGKTRKLGIPTVVDRVVQQAIAQELTPQGGPLSPLLGNVMLNELDKELERRGHKFVRYADDCMILCRTRKSAQRTLDHIVPYIKGKLFLKVNLEKTTVAHISKVKYLGYSFYRYRGNGTYGGVEGGLITRPSDDILTDLHASGLSGAAGEVSKWS